MLESGQEIEGLSYEGRTNSEIQQTFSYALICCLFPICIWNVWPILNYASAFWLLIYKNYIRIILYTRTYIYIYTCNVFICSVMVDIAASYCYVCDIYARYLSYICNQIISSRSICGWGPGLCPNDPGLSSWRYKILWSKKTYIPKYLY